MLARSFWTLVVLGFAIGAFLGAAPTDESRIPFGIFFLVMAGFVWLKWRWVKAAFDRRAVMDDVAGSYWGSDANAGPKVPEIDTNEPRRRE